jgi:hypothetical protein
MSVSGEEHWRLRAVASTLVRGQAVEKWQDCQIATGFSQDA